MVLVLLWEDTGKRMMENDYSLLPYPVVSHLSSSSFHRSCQTHSQTMFLSGIVTGIYTYIHVHTYINISIYTHIYICVYIVIV